MIFITFNLEYYASPMCSKSFEWLSFKQYMASWFSGKPKQPARTVPSVIKKGNNFIALIGFYSTLTLL